MKKQKKLIFIILTVMIVLAAGYFFYRKYQNDPKIEEPKADIVISYKLIDFATKKPIMAESIEDKVSVFDMVNCPDVIDNDCTSFPYSTTFREKTKGEGKIYITKQEGYSRKYPTKIEFTFKAEKYSSKTVKVDLEKDKEVVVELLGYIKGR